MEEKEFDTMTLEEKLVDMHKDLEDIKGRLSELFGFIQGVVVSRNFIR